MLSYLRPYSIRDTVAQLSLERKMSIVAALLHRAGQIADENFANKVAEEVRLTPRQYMVLTAASESPGISQTGLVAMTGIDRSTLADIVRRLVEDKGLLNRRRDKNDARAYAVSLTSTGKDVLNRMKEPAEEADRATLSALSEAERKQLLKMLDRIVKHHES